MALSSMTGFARAGGVAGSYGWAWELKSVNAKGLELRLRLAFLDKIPRLGDRYFRSRLVSDMAQRCAALSHACFSPGGANLRVWGRNGAACSAAARTAWLSGRRAASHYSRRRLRHGAFGGSGDLASAGESLRCDPERGVAPG